MILSALVFGVFANHAFAEDHFILWDQNFEQGHSAQIVELIAESTVDEFGGYKLTRSIHLEQGRAVEELSRGRTLNIAVMGNDKERERKLAPIYVPIDMGELGLRICLINRGSQHLFSNIRNAKQAQQADLVFGMGSYWPDTAIFSGNGFNVYSTPVFENVFKALAKGRFDCMHRSISEVIGDLEKHTQDDFIIEEKLAFVYPLANFIYLAKNSPLTKRVRAGLNKLVASGKLEQFNDAYLQSHLTELAFFKRRLIILENPNLTAKARKAINDYGLISFEQAGEP